MPDSLFLASDTASASVVNAAPDLSLLVGLRDDAFLVGPCEPPRKGGTYVRGSVWVVVHRGHGPWTHVYRVLEERCPGRALVHLDKVFEGERADEARRWALGRLAPA